MKKFGIVLLLIAMCFIVGCNDNKLNDGMINNNKGVYTFSYNGMEFTLGDVFTTDKYGEEISYSEVPSCAFEGIDKTYTYDNYEVTTYPDGDTDRISNVLLKGTDVKTPEGVGILDTKDDMISKYGNDFKQNENQYTYTLENTHLEFVIEDDVISSIEYYIDLD